MDAGGYDEVLVSREDGAPCSEANVEIKIKMMDSQTYTLHVDKYVPVPALKEQIASVTGVLSEHQRLICRGKVLKDDQLLSAYHVEDGHTLHLVVKQPVTSTGSVADDSAAPVEGNDGNTRPRVMVGTFNLSEQGDGSFPDFSQVVSAVLGSFGLTNIGSLVEGADLRGNTRTREATEDSVRQQIDQPVFWGQSDHPVNDAPPSSRGTPNNFVNMGIPDSLTTMSNYLGHLRREFRTCPINSDAAGPHVENGNESAAVPSAVSLQGWHPSPSSLVSALSYTRALLTEDASDCLSQLAEQIEESEDVTDPSVRAQVQSNSLRIGNLLQKLGALLYELGRTTMMLRMGHGPADAVVNAGPALFISNSAPRPIMVQPVPFHTGGSFSEGPLDAGVHSHPGIIGGSFGSGFLPRNVDIRIRSASREGESTEPPQSQSQNGWILGNDPTRRGAEIRVVPVRTTMVAAVPASIPHTHDSSNSRTGSIYPFITGIRDRSNNRDSVPPSYLEALMNHNPHTRRENDDDQGNVPMQDTSPPPVVTEEGIFLSNILTQIMPIISQSSGGSTSNTSSNEGQGCSRSQQADLPSPKRQKRE